MGCRPLPEVEPLLSQGHSKLHIHLPQEDEEQVTFIQNLPPTTWDFAALNVSSCGPGRTRPDGLLPLCISGLPCKICLWHPGRWSSPSSYFPFPLPQVDPGDRFTGAWREVWGAGERGGALAAWLGGITFTLSPRALGCGSVGFPGRQEVIWCCC